MSEKHSISLPLWVNKDQSIMDKIFFKQELFLVSSKAISIAHTEGIVPLFLLKCWMVGG